MRVEQGISECVPYFTLQNTVLSHFIQNRNICIPSNRTTSFIKSKDILTESNRHTLVTDLGNNIATKQRWTVSFVNANSQDLPASGHLLLAERCYWISPATALPSQQLIPDVCRQTHDHVLLPDLDAAAIANFWINKLFKMNDIKVHV